MDESAKNKSFIANSRAFIEEESHSLGITVVSAYDGYQWCLSAAELTPRTTLPVSADDALVTQAKSTVSGLGAWSVRVATVGVLATFGRGHSFFYGPREPKYALSKYAL